MNRRHYSYQSEGASIKHTQTMKRNERIRDQRTINVKAYMDAWEESNMCARNLSRMMHILDIAPCCVPGGNTMFIEDVSVDELRNKVPRELLEEILRDLIIIREKIKDLKPGRTMRFKNGEFVENEKDDPHYGVPEEAIGRLKESLLPL